MREYIATKDVKDKCGLLDAYTSWITYKKEAYDLDKYRKTMVRLAAVEKELQTYKSKDSKESKHGTGTSEEAKEESSVEKLVAALCRGTFRERNGVAGPSQPRQPYGNQRGRGWHRPSLPPSTPRQPAPFGSTVCYNCNKTGHVARDCWARPGKQPTSYESGYQASSRPGPSYRGRGSGSYGNRGNTRPQPKNSRTYP